MKFSCGISSRSDFVKKFIEQFPPTKAQSTKSGCAFFLPAPYTAGFMQKLILAGRHNLCLPALSAPKARQAAAVNGAKRSS
jgi:hypothetical protein